MSVRFILSETWNTGMLKLSDPPVGRRPPLVLRLVLPVSSSLKESLRRKKKHGDAESRVARGPKTHQQDQYGRYAHSSTDEVVHDIFSVDLVAG